MNISEKKLKYLIVAISIVIPVVVTLLRYLPSPELSDEATSSIRELSKLNAIINGTTFFTLIAAWFAIKNKNISLHKKLTTVAIILSVLFLISYIIYHYCLPHIEYCKDYYPLYLFILFSHIVLSAVIVPLALYTYIRGSKMEVEKHRRLAKITWPLWLYVTATGVIVYLMLDGCPFPS